MKKSIKDQTFKKTSPNKGQGARKGAVGMPVVVAEGKAKKGIQSWTAGQPKISSRWSELLGKEDDERLERQTVKVAEVQTPCETRTLEPEGKRDIEDEPVDPQPKIDLRSTSTTLPNASPQGGAGGVAVDVVLGALLARKDSQSQSSQSSSTQSNGRVQKPHSEKRQIEPRDQSGRSKRPDGSYRTCRGCGSEFHFAAQCPKKRGNNQSAKTGKSILADQIKDILAQKAGAEDALKDAGIELKARQEDSHLIAAVLNGAQIEIEKSREEKAAADKAAADLAEKQKEEELLVKKEKEDLMFKGINSFDGKKWEYESVPDAAGRARLVGSFVWCLTKKVRDLLFLTSVRFLALFLFSYIAEFILQLSSLVPFATFCYSGDSNSWFGWLLALTETAALGRARAVDKIAPFRAAIDLFFYGRSSSSLKRGLRFIGQMTWIVTVLTIAMKFLPLLDALIFLWTYRRWVSTAFPLVLAGAATYVYRFIRIKHIFTVTDFGLPRTARQRTIDLRPDSIALADIKHDSPIVTEFRHDTEMLLDFGFFGKLGGFVFSTVSGSFYLELAIQMISGANRYFPDDATALAFFRKQPGRICTVNTDRFEDAANCLTANTSTVAFAMYKDFGRLQEEVLDPR